MLYLALVSPLVVLGFLLMMQLFEAWMLGDADRRGSRGLGASRSTVTRQHKPMAPRVDLCGRPAAMTVGAPDVALLDLGDDRLPGHGAAEQTGHIVLFRGAVPVVELQTSDVPFAAVDAQGA